MTKAEDLAEENARLRQVIAELKASGAADDEIAYGDENANGTARTPRAEVQSAKTRYTKNRLINVTPSSVLMKPSKVPVKRKDALAFRVAVQASRKLGLETPLWVALAADLVVDPLAKETVSDKSSVKRGAIGRAGKRKLGLGKNPSAGAARDLARLPKSGGARPTQD